ncbi:MAG: conjugal transfer protein TraG N-terminal domain-containing protein [Henriciella sp.]|nr:conjugal transfer protein TraG N-terminal domain-containing protein [Henriciella sp.]MBO6696303.1 conjugal transfer protein TraG N-terminal domain-containing protein [Henriciella sp.]
MEVIVTGGGEFIVDVLNAVAAFTGSGAFASLIRVVLIIGLALAAWQVAVSMNFKAGFDFLVKSTVIYLVLLVPTVNVTVTDRVSGTPVATVNNVPVGLAVPASITTTIGSTLTGAFETLFAEPADMAYSTHGFGYALQVQSSLDNWRAVDTWFSRNLTGYTRDCVFPDINAGLTAIDDLVTATDLVPVLATSASPALFTRYELADGTVTVETCANAWTGISAGLAAAADNTIDRQAQLSKPHLTNAEARAVMLSSLPIIYQQFVGVSQSAQQIAQQVILVNSTMDAVVDYSARADASAAVEAYAAARAEQEAKWNYTVLGAIAEKFVNFLYIAITVIVIAIFPIIAPFFLLPNIGFSFMQKYFAGFLYLQMWGPLFAVIHYIITRQGYDAINASAQMPGTLGQTIQTSLGMSATAADLSGIGGLLITMIPFLAAAGPGIAVGVGRLHESFLAPVKSASQTAAAEAATGNLGFGNANIGNQTLMTSSAGNATAGQIRLSPSYDVGHASYRDPEGRNWTRTSGGVSLVDETAGHSRYQSGFATSLDSNAMTSIGRSVYRSEGDTRRESASKFYGETETDLSRLTDMLSRMDSQDAQVLSERGAALTQSAADYGSYQDSRLDALRAGRSMTLSLDEFQGRTASIAEGEQANINVGLRVGTPSGGGSNSSPRPKNGRSQGGRLPVSGGLGTDGNSYKRGENRADQGYRVSESGSLNSDRSSTDSSSYDEGQQYRDELSGFVRDAESVMERQQHQEGLSLARETSADFRRGEEARQQAEAYYTEASTYTASADDRMGRGGSINANEVAAFETFLVSHLSNLNGRTVSTREAQEYWVDLSSSDMGRAEQRAVQSGFFESRLRPESFGAPSGFSQPDGRAYAPIGSFSGEAAQSAAFESAASDRNIRFDERSTPVETPTSAAVQGRFTDMIGQQSEVQEYVRGSGDDVAHQTAITNGEAHVQRYGLESYVEWAGGEENARAVMGDERFEELVRVEAEKAEEDRRLRSAR